MLSIKRKDNARKVTVFLGYGSITAVMVSWYINKSILWALLHMLFGWYYVIYALTGKVLLLLH